MRIETVAYAGWNECIRISNGTVDVVVTTQVGPRIIRYGFSDGPNVFVEYPEQVGRSGESQYRSYGGHRLWVAPETPGWTNHPDNGPVTVSKENDRVRFTAAPERGTGLQKSIAVSLGDEGTGVHVRHTVTNTGPTDVLCALWALSVMAAGGTAVIPHERFISHAEKVLPAGPLVLWHYTDMTDPRWTWGRRYVRLRQAGEPETPQKLGALCSHGWAGYANAGVLFLKRFPFHENASYPDFGVNLEIFTNKRMLEVESLGPLLPLPPTGSRDHAEQWELHRTSPLPEDEELLHSLLADIVPSA